jgi:hypothetical protein
LGNPNTSRLYVLINIYSPTGINILQVYIGF